MPKAKSRKETRPDATTFLQREQQHTPLLRLRLPGSDRSRSRPLKDGFDSSWNGDATRLERGRDVLRSDVDGSSWVSVEGGGRKGEGGGSCRGRIRRGKIVYGADRARRSGGGRSGRDDGSRVGRKSSRRRSSRVGGSDGFGGESGIGRVEGAGRSRGSSGDLTRLRGSTSEELSLHDLGLRCCGERED